MKRVYSLDDYVKAIYAIKETVPGAAITTDIMLGFPGESEEDFEQSYRFCQQAGFANIHVFPFSSRPGTQAARMPDQIKDQVKKERTQRMLKLAQECRERFYKQFVGNILPILWERETTQGNGIYSGLTDNYIRVFAQSYKPLTNKIVPVKLEGFDNHGIWGKLVSENSS
jgi:threonylcarbamoyladenosine tRNA methylthiotransferase MtaB